MKKLKMLLFAALIIIIVVVGVIIVNNSKINISIKNDITDNYEKEDILFKEYYSIAEELMKSMTLEEKVGQMFLARYPESNILDEIRKENPGGYVLFSRDFDNKTKEQIIEELNKNQEESKIKLFLAVDEEGGSVVRVSNHKALRDTSFLSPSELWNQGELQAVINDSHEKTQLLKNIGINMNLAPVADVTTNETSYMYKRALGKSAEETSIYVSEVIKTMNKDNIISSMKHFPGYGENIDTHKGIAIDERPYSVFETSDFLPFKSGIGVDGPCVLVSHNIVKSIDENMPASLSEETHQILREDLKFTGIIMTDDLAMDAVKDYVENGEATVKAIQAGNDIIISSDFVKQKQEVIKAVNEGRIKEEMINEAVIKILACKYYYGIIK